MILGTSIVAVPAIEAKTTTNALTANTDPQVRIQIGRNRRYNRWERRRMRRVVTTTRVRRVGRLLYRETIRRVYLPNGTVRTTVISRQRIWA